jgi:hypothetical protein
VTSPGDALTHEHQFGSSLIYTCRVYGSDVGYILHALFKSVYAPLQTVTLGARLCQSSP